MRPLESTYRLQLNADFNFAQALALVPYLRDLGVSHAYLSPILAAQPGSTHGYDTVDHTRINPELGSADAFAALARALHAEGLGVILDFVPNHMGVGGAHNGLWLDVLRHGPASSYADWFDIDWDPPRPDLKGKLLLPFLGSSLRDALEQGQLALKSDQEGLAIWAYDKDKLPLRPEDEAELIARHGSAEAAAAALADPGEHAERRAALGGLIGRQHWALRHFSAAADEINYRRFFINSELAGIRIERPDVFDYAHSLIFDLIAEGLVDGLRIDHVDGLRDPTGYLTRLRASSPRPILLFVEKILAPHEQLRADWPVDGTTGYEFGALLTRLLTRADAETALSDTYAREVGEVVPPEAESARSKLGIMDTEMTAELMALARRAARLAWSVPETRDITEAGMARGLRAIAATIAVYRSYADAEGLSERDRREIDTAVEGARRDRPDIQPFVFDFLEQALLDTLPGPYDPAAAMELRLRFQQFTGPVIAKGLEDTALYRFNRLVALNEVGAHPEDFSASVERFHDANRQRLQQHPRTLLATTTHDTKRGEDTRALIAAISHHPQQWAEIIARWRDLLQPEIHPADFYLFAQLLVGGWPLGSADPAPLGERLKKALEKSLREARLRSNWGVPDTEYEGRVADFVDRALGDAAFVERFHADRAPLLATGRNLALAQLALKLTVPGVPDIYRGAEDWEQSYVDPDNRRPVDFSVLAQRLAAAQPGQDDKLALTAGLLALRRRRPELFLLGQYEPLPGAPGEVRFARHHGLSRLEVTVKIDGTGFAPDPGAGLAGPEIALPCRFTLEDN